MKKSILFFIVSLFLFTPNISISRNKIICGYVEKVYIKNINSHYTALIDTGAFYSTLHAYGISGYRKRNRLLVTFYTRNRKGIRRKKTLPVKKIVWIRSSIGASQKRYAVLMKIKLGKVIKKTVVTLTNRSRQKQLMIIGRNFLKGNFLINSEKKFMIH